MSEQAWWQQRPLPQPMRAIVAPVAVTAAVTWYAANAVLHAVGDLVLPQGKPGPFPSPVRTVGELRQCIRHLSDDLEITVRTCDDDGDFCGGITSALVQIEHGEEETPFLAIDCMPEDSRSPEAEDTRPIGIPLENGTVMHAHVAKDASPESIEALRTIGNAVAKQMTELPPDVQALLKLDGLLEKARAERDTFAGMIAQVSDIFEIGNHVMPGEFVSKMAEAHAQLETLRENALQAGEAD